jgi:metal-responsive CopG/Arc/MetJ family transcriptional regulator
MIKKVIQVPVDEELLRDLDSLSKKQRKARAELIRQACSSYLQKAKDQELDMTYQQGYLRIPEEPEEGETQIAISGQILPGESW